jgi:inorganic pyrophosphatase
VVPQPGAISGDDVNVIVESPRGSTAKFKRDEQSGLFMLSRPLPAGLLYPCDWGFIPQTLAEDGDPLDAFAVWDGRSYPGILIVSRPIGVLRVSQTMHSTGVTSRNDRVAVVPTADNRLRDLRRVEDLPQRTRDELQQFFAASVAFEPKRVEFHGWGGPDEAWETIRRAARTA